MMSAALKGEQAETESINNAITKYTASIGMDFDRLLAAGGGMHQEEQQAQQPVVDFDYNPMTGSLTRANQ